MEMDDSGKKDKKRPKLGVSWRRNALLIPKSDASIQLVVTAAFELHLNMSRKVTLPALLR